MHLKCKKSLLTIVWVLAICYHIASMLFEAGSNEFILKLKSGAGVLALLLAGVLIILFKRKKRIRFPRLLGIVSASVMFFPIVSAVLNGQALHYSVFLRVWLWVLLFIVFYYATLYYGEFPLDKKLITISYLLLMIASVPLIRVHLSGNGRAGAVIFPVYGCLTILPLLLHCSTPRKRYAFIFMTAFIMLATTKRAGIIAAVLGFVLYYLTADGKASVKKRTERVIKIAVLAVVFGTVTIGVLQYMGFNIIQRFLALATDGGSGRNYIWATVLDAFNQGSKFQQFVGHGIDAVSEQVVIYSDVQIKAHNDFIEVLFDYGYIGLFIFLLFYFLLLREWIQQFRKHTKELPIYSFSMAIAAVFMMFSYFFIESSVINFIAAYWGTVLAERKIEERKIVKNGNTF